MYRSKDSIVFTRNDPNREKTDGGFDNIGKDSKKRVETGESRLGRSSIMGNNTYRGFSFMEIRQSYAYGADMYTGRQKQKIHRIKTKDDMINSKYYQSSSISSSAGDMSSSMDDSKYKSLNKMSTATNRNREPLYIQSLTYSDVIKEKNSESRRESSSSSNYSPSVQHRGE